MQRTITIAIVALFATSAFVTPALASNPLEDLDVFNATEGREDEQLVEECRKQLGFDEQSAMRGNVFQYKIRRCVNNKKNLSERQRYIDQTRAKQEERRKVVYEKAQELKEKLSRRYNRSKRLKYRQRLQLSRKRNTAEVKQKFRRVRSSKREAIRQRETERSTVLKNRRAYIRSARISCAHTEGDEKVKCIQQQIHNLNVQ